LESGHRLENVRVEESASRQETRTRQQRGAGAPNPSQTRIKQLWNIHVASSCPTAAFDVQLFSRARIPLFVEIADNNIFLSPRAAPEGGEICELSKE
jgi:hypothetical protein